MQPTAQPSAHMVVHQQMQEYSGEIPHPDILLGFDQVVPGTALRLIDAAMAETSHRRKLEADITAWNVSAQAAQGRIAEGQMSRIFHSDVVGQILGFCICAGAIYAAYRLGIAGHEWLAAGIAAIPNATVIQAFRANFFTRKEPLVKNSEKQNSLRKHAHHLSLPLATIRP